MFWYNASSCETCGKLFVPSAAGEKVCSACASPERAGWIPIPEEVLGIAAAQCRWCHGTKKIIGFSHEYDCTECEP